MATSITPRRKGRRGKLRQGQGIRYTTQATLIIFNIHQYFERQNKKSKGRGKDEFQRTVEATVVF
jgi:hypothetical protein